MAIISIHAPCTGSDTYRSRRFSACASFQSTLPARGATNQPGHDARHTGHFNPRSLHGERRAPATSGRPRELFQSTLPARGATVCRDVPTPRVAISIHAPCTGSDLGIATRQMLPRRFQSTLPARGATGRDCNGGLHQRHFNPRSLHGERRRGSHKPRHHNWEISIHAPCTGSDAIKIDGMRLIEHFNPRSLHGERRKRFQIKPGNPAISIHAPCTGSDAKLKIK